MKASFLKQIKTTAIAVLAITGLFAAIQAADAEESCQSTCSLVFADKAGLVCCGGSCDLSTYCNMVCACGNGVIDSTCGVTEQCDDGNSRAGDGCDQDCHVETGGE